MRKAQKIGSCPRWLEEADLEAIRALYRMAQRITDCMGIQHEVYHYYPLQGETVCGLHVPWNLRVVPAAINRRKTNHMPKPIYIDADTGN